MRYIAECEPSQYSRSAYRQLLGFVHPYASID